jgi:hypothetical protein
MENPSIYISYLFKDIKRDKIYKVINTLQLGEIAYIDIHIGVKFHRALIYFKRWYDTEYAQNIKKRFLDDEELKIIYDDPTFWKCKRGGDSMSVGIMKKILENEIKEKDKEIERLRQIISSMMGDDALLRRKHQQQKNKEYS